MGANAAKSCWLRGPGCQGPGVLRCSPEPESLSGSLGLKKRKANPHKLAIHCNFGTAAVLEAPVTPDKLKRIKLIILASLQHQIAMPVARVWWYIMGDLVLPWLGWPSRKSPWSCSIILHHLLLLWIPVTYKTLALLMLTWASSSRPARVTSALLQTGFSDSVACCFYGKSGQQLSPMPLPAESKPKPSRSGFLLHLYH